MIQHYQHIKSLLQEAGMKTTPQRLAVLDYMISCKCHPCVDEVYQAVCEHVPDISKATVYKVLESFAQEGILSKMSTNDGKLKYDYIDERHHHMFDVENGEIKDFADHELDEILNKYFRSRKIDGYVIEDVKLEIKVKKQNKNN
ncbi:MAG: hypothetical protein C0592_05215 [Marinilabiliales bacterium]|nr:MAG: hypothetical protein C0592_05215 [Marinilabiliales bacterium]